jgi:CspA family cold shock protein
MQHGIVKWYNEGQGWGVIIPDEGTAKLIVGDSDILGGGFKVLEAGERVSFDVVETAQGPAAINVRIADGRR